MCEYPCVCLCGIRVCVCVQSVCVFDRGAKSIVFYGVWGARGAPKTQQSEMLREPHSNKNRFSLQVCVCFRPCFKGENDHRQKYVCVCVCVQSVCVFCAIRVCVLLVKVRPGAKSIVFYGVWGGRGAPQRGTYFLFREPPSKKKIYFRSRYVCLFVPVLRAKTTISKSMCVFVCNPCVCFVQSVCVFVCNPCVCLWPIFHRKLRVFLGMPKKLQGWSFYTCFYV